MDEITRILNAADAGDERSAEKLLPLVYDQLRRLAADKLRRLRSGNTLQATALVHEAWIRIAGKPEVDWENRAKFFAAAAEAMRRILIDRIRKKHSQKHGGGAEHQELHESAIAQTAPSEELLAVHEALDQLSKLDPKASDLVKLRYFVGMSMNDASQALGMPLRNTERLWTYAKAFLRREIERS